MVAALAGWTGTARGAGGPTVERPHVRVRLVTDAAAVAPGGRVSLAVVFTIDRQWHIYWRNNGEAAGLPTSLTLKLPPGWQAGAWRYPVPTVHEEAEIGTSFVHEGTAAMVCELTAPADARPGKAALSVEASWLVCKRECIKGDATLTVEQPVVAAGTKASPDNAELFSKARQALPLTAGEAKYVALKLEGGRTTIRPGDQWDATLRVTVEAGHHIQSHRPAGEGLVATELFLDPPDGVTLRAEPKFPAGKSRVDPVLGKVDDYSGTVEIGLPLAADTDLPNGPVTLYGVLRYQACTDRGVCYRPMAVEFEATFSGAGGAKTEATPAGKRADGAAGAPAMGGKPGADAVGAKPAGDSSGAAADAASEETPEDGGTWLDRATAWFQARGLYGHLLMALLGGFILNFMPCVLPVISIKILTFVQQAHEHRWRVLVLGLAFAAGVVVSFAVLGLLILVLDSQWGGLFQKPQVVIGMAAVVMAFALSLFGVFSLNPPRAVNELGARVQGQEGVASAFATGLLATALGTACTAPFLSAVVAIATSMARQGQTMAAFGIFLGAGVGMASPYVLLTAQPGWLRVLPRPGPWMGVFERIVGFLLLATVVWLLNPLTVQIGPDGILATLVFLVIVGMAAWMIELVPHGAPGGRRGQAMLGALALVVVGWVVTFHLWRPIPALADEMKRVRQALLLASGGADWGDGSRIPWQPYSRERVARAVEAGNTVFIDYTAEWCVNCKANEKLVIDTPAVRGVMRDLMVVPFRADYTVEDPEIKADLAKYKRAGVPMYLVIPGGRPKGAVVLPEILTQKVVNGALRAAGPSAPKLAQGGAGN